jgi:hypothetical protein
MLIIGEGTTSDKLVAVQDALKRQQLEDVLEGKIALRPDMFEVKSV